MEHTSRTMPTTNNPYEPFFDFDRIVEETSHSIHPKPKTSSGNIIDAFKPRMDLHNDTEKNLMTATFELPGIKQEEVSLEIYNGTLTVSAESKISSEHEDKGYAVRERRYGNFSRSIQVSPGVKEDDIKVSMQNGLLIIQYPRFS